MDDITMQTRSKTCRRSKSGPCKRLAGHNGACRPTLTKAEGRRPVADVLASLDFVKVVVETPTARVKAGKPPVAMTPKASRPKRRKVRVLPTAGPEGRDTQHVGHAKRAKAAPQGTKSRSNANALKGRI